MSDLKEVISKLTKRRRGDQLEVSNLIESDEEIFGSEEQASEEEANGQNNDEFLEMERNNNLTYLRKDERERNMGWLFMQFDRDLNQFQLKGTRKQRYDLKQVVKTDDNTVK